ncbi:MAG TPA: hypothetical protein VHS96_14540, partial [Bacteroidia bacterium]|nr:hypothetical protein [Bacteroidia bacterium]
HLRKLVLRHGKRLPPLPQCLDDCQCFHFTCNVLKLLLFPHTKDAIPCTFPHKITSFPSNLQPKMPQKALFILFSPNLIQQISKHAV